MQLIVVMKKRASSSSDETLDAGGKSVTARMLGSEMVKNGIKSPLRV